MSVLEKIIVGLVVVLVLAAVVFIGVVLFAPSEEQIEVVETDQTPSTGVRAPVIMVTPKAAEAVPRAQSIRGFVKEPDGKPVPDALVSLVLEEADVPTAESQARERVIRTGPDGSFLFDELAPGRYTVKAEVKGYADQVVGGVRIGEDVDVVLSPGGALSGVIKSKGDGKPIPNARVTIKLLAHRFMNWGTIQERSVRADEQGRYRFENVTPGWWQVLAEAPGFLQEDDARVQIRPGLQTSQDLGLVLPNEVWGRIIDARTKQPIKGAKVGIGGGGAVQAPPFATTTTDENGVWKFTLRPTGGETLRVEAPGYVPSGLMGVSWDTSKSKYQVQDIALVPGAAASGTVVDYAGKPVSGARIDVSESFEFDYIHSAIYTGEPFGMRRIKASTILSNDKGEFTINTLQPGKRVQFVAFKDGYLVGHTDYYDVPPSGPLTNVRITLPRGARLHGQVVDEEGKPIVRARVLVRTLPMRREFELQPGGRGLPSDNVAYTDSNGRYELRALWPSEDALVRVDALNYEPQALTLRISPDAEISQNFRLTAGLSISGVVLDNDRKPFPRVEVLATSSGATTGTAVSSKARTDENGRFVIKGLASGLYTLVASYPNTVDELLHNVQAGSANMEIILSRPAMIEGVVNCSDPNQSIIVQAKERQTGRTATANIKAGQFVLENLRPGTYDITVAATEPDYEVQKIPSVVVGPGDKYFAGNVSLVKVSQPPPTLDTPPGKRMELVQREIYPNQETAPVQFQDQEIGLFVAGGNGILTVGNEKINVQRGDVRTIPKGMPFSVRNTGTETLLLFISKEAD